MTTETPLEDKVWLYVPADDREEVRLLNYGTDRKLLEQLYLLLNCRMIELVPVLNPHEPWADLDNVRLIIDEEGKYVTDARVNHRACRLFRQAYVLESVHLGGRIIASRPVDVIMGDAIICTQSWTEEDGWEIAPWEPTDTLMWSLHNLLRV